MNNLKFILPALLVLLLSSCNLLSEKQQPSDKQESDTSAYTGVRKYYSGGRLLKEVSFVNGVRNGLCKNYYDDGRLKSTIYYVNGLREDTTRWYYPEGMVYRETPYQTGVIHGTQIKYYKNGKIQASMPYIHGYRLPGLKEYTDRGLEVKQVPKLEYTLKDMYDLPPYAIRIFLKLSNGSVNVDYYLGSLKDGAFNPSLCKKVTVSSGMGYIELKKGAGKGAGYIDVIAVYKTPFGNKEILTRRIKLPYKDIG